MILCLLDCLEILDLIVVIDLLRIVINIFNKIIMMYRINVKK